MAKKKLADIEVLSNTPDSVYVNPLVGEEQPAEQTAVKPPVQEPEPEPAKEAPVKKAKAPAEKPFPGIKTFAISEEDFKFLEDLRYERRVQLKEVLHEAITLLRNKVAREKSR